MSSPHLTRRGFNSLIGTALGGALLAETRAGTQSAKPPAREVSPARAIRLDSNENPYGPSPKALAALDRSRGEAARYPDDLEDKVTEAIARLHGVRPENVLLGCGSGEILRMADMAFLQSGRTVVAPMPTFEAVLHYAKVTRAEAVTVPLTPDYRHDLPGMAAACDARTGLVYVCNPNNPTGTIVKGDELDRFLGAVPESTVVLVDEAYHHFVEDPAYRSAADEIGRHANLLVVRTFSKIYGLAGMRLGYGLGAKEKIEAMRPHKTWSNANAGVLEAVLASLEEPAHVESERQRMNDTRRFLCAELEKSGRRYIPSHANFVMIDLGRDVQDTIEALRARQVFPGRRFAAMPNWLRVSIGTREETSAFLTALREVAPMKERAA